MAKVGNQMMQRLHKRTRQRHLSITQHLEFKMFLLNKNAGFMWGPGFFLIRFDMVLTRQSVIFPPCERSKPQYGVGNQSLQQTLFHITSNTGRIGFLIQLTLRSDK